MNLLRSFEEFDVLRVRAGPASFDKGYAQLIQFAGNAQLIGAGKGNADPLGPVSQGSVVDLYVHKSIDPKKL